MNRSSSLLFYKLVSAAIFAGVVASFAGLNKVYRNTNPDTESVVAATDARASRQPVGTKTS